MASKNSPLSRKDNIVVQELKDEILIYDLKENKAFCLNETSALVWQMCDGNNSVSEIKQSIGKKFNSPVTEDFVWLAIDQLKKDNLLVNGEEIVSDFDGMSRREVIRKIGFSSAVALPVIASLVAPTAAQTTSTCIASGQANVVCSSGTTAAACRASLPACCPSCTTCDTAAQCNENRNPICVCGRVCNGTVTAGFAGSTCPF